MTREDSREPPMGAWLPLPTGERPGFRSLVRFRERAILEPSTLLRKQPSRVAERSSSSSGQTVRSGLEVRAPAGLHDRTNPAGSTGH